MTLKISIEENGEFDMGKMINDILIRDFLPENQVDLEGVKFKIGQEVIFTPKGEEVKTKGVVLAVENSQDTPEYMIDTWPYLVWEFELEALDID
jgi:hypothetical protein